jgi:hypothetical protein
LHIGTHKTATTTIQDTFHKNAALLEQHGLIYPHLGKVTGHHALAYDWLNLPPVYKPQTSSLEGFSALARQYAHRDVTVFVSSEEFSRENKNATVDLAAVRDRLSAFDEIEVICVLRTQWQFMQSIYLELSRRNNPPRPSKISNPAMNTGMTMGMVVDYNLILDRLEKVFAPEEITLMDFATCGKAQGRILGHLLRHLKIDLSGDALEQVNGGASNVSPHPLATWMANIMAEPTSPPDWLVNVTTSVLQEEYPSNPRACLFTQKEFDVLNDHFAPLNDRLYERRQAVQPDFRITQAGAETVNLFRNQINLSNWAKLSRKLVRDKILAERPEPLP